jgi:hypothetical protein
MVIGERGDREEKREKRKEERRKSVREASDAYFWVSIKGKRERMG